MDKKFDPFMVVFDEEEQEIADYFEKGNWIRVADYEERIELAQTAARNTLKKDARVNIRISSQDLMSLKQQAAYKGLLYQTFIASVLHEYAAGHFSAR